MSARTPVASAVSRVGGSRRGGPASRTVGRTRAAFSAFAVILAAAATTHAAPPPPPDDGALAAARRLFAEALRDQEGSRFEVALEKFERVRSVRDTAPIRYRIANCNEALGRLRRAARGYEAAIELGQSSTPGTPGASADADVVRGARERLEALAKKAARLDIALRGQTAEAAVQVDDEPLAMSELERGAWLDPGGHVVTATAKGAAPWRTEMALPPGGRASLVVELVSLDAQTPHPPDADNEKSVADTGTGARTPSNAEPSSRSRTAGWIALGAGAALAAGAGIVFVLRHGEISKLQDACPGGRCPSNQEAELTSAHDRAAFEGPLGAGLLIGGAAAAVTGAILLFTSPSAARTRVAPVVSPQHAGLVVEGPL